MQYRQGDVFIERVEKKPAKVAPVARDGGRVILAYGEVTGHAHAIGTEGATLYALPGADDRWLEVEEAVILRHEEHGPIDLEPGVYRVRIQREYYPKKEPRKVRD